LQQPIEEYSQDYKNDQYNPGSSELAGLKQVDDCLNTERQGKINQPLKKRENVYVAYFRSFGFDETP
jgi:hypothetical protein